MHSIGISRIVPILMSDQMATRRARRWSVLISGDRDDSKKCLDNEHRSGRECGAVGKMQTVHT